MMIFDGNAAAQAKEVELTKQIRALAGQGKQLKIAAILFEEDQGSVLYTRLKREAAERVGISYDPYQFSLKGKTQDVLDLIEKLNSDATVTGIIIQKPWRHTWVQATGVDGDPKDIKQAFNMWWHLLTSRLDQQKDVDGLHPQTLEAIKNNTWQELGRVLPATCQAVLDILNHSGRLRPDSKIVILGKSDLLGLPLSYELTNKKYEVDLLDSKSLLQRIENKIMLLDADIIVSATGRANLITGDLVREGVAVVDVGEPQGDVEFATVSSKAAFMTPVPGGVGPMTVACLLENAVKLVS